MKKALSYATLLLLAVVLLGACAKRAEIGQGGTPGLSPTPVASTSPSTSGAAAGSGDAAAGRAGAPSESRVTRPTGPAVTSSAAGSQSGAQGAQGAQAAGPLQDVFFDFDKDVIRDDQRTALDGNAGWLKSHPAARVTIEGHADERGTSEYNLALGDRRAKTTRDYLVAKGIEPSRVTIVSYGEERPFVMGHDESAWRWNRRSHFVVTGQ